MHINVKTAKTHLHTCVNTKPNSIAPTKVPAKLRNPVLFCSGLIRVWLTWKWLAGSPSAHVAPASRVSPSEGSVQGSMLEKKALGGC